MTIIRDLVKAIEVFDNQSIDKVLHDYILGNSLPMGKIMNSLRLCLVGASNGPSVADIVAIIGKNEFVTRVDNAIEKLQ